MTFKNSSHATTKQVAYEYDSLDRRVRKRVDETGNGSWDRGEQYVYDGAHIALQFDDGGTLERRNLFGPAVDQILASEFIGSPNETNWYLADHLGTVRDVFSYDNSTDTLTNEGHIEYDSFGNILSGLAAATLAHFAYTGREWDADAELFYYHHRWYDAVLGQFISQNPIGFAAGDTNARRYVGNIVMSLYDPTGLHPPAPNVPWDDILRDMSMRQEAILYYEQHFHIRVGQYSPHFERWLAAGGYQRVI